MSNKEPLIHISKTGAALMEKRMAHTRRRDYCFALVFCGLITLMVHGPKSTRGSTCICSGPLRHGSKELATLPKSRNTAVRIFAVTPAFKMRFGISARRAGAYGRPCQPLPADAPGGSPQSWQVI